MTSVNQETPSNSNRRYAFGLIISVAVCFLAAGIGAWVTAASVNSWYLGINKPPWNPPDWIFGPVWSALYLMMAISAWLVWKTAESQKTRVALSCFALQLLLNVFWSILFFGLQQPGWAAIEIVGLWVSIAVTILLFSRQSKLAAGLLVPYLLWVTFAAYLNYTIWVLNPAV